MQETVIFGSRGWRQASGAGPDFAPPSMPGALLLAYRGAANHATLPPADLQRLAGVLRPTGRLPIPVTGWEGMPQIGPARPG
jgi:hypothetical protein